MNWGDLSQRALVEAAMLRRPTVTTPARIEFIEDSRRVHPKPMGTLPVLPVSRTERGQSLD